MKCPPLDNGDEGEIESVRRGTRPRGVPRDSGMVHGAAILNNLTIKFIVPLEHAYPRGAFGPVEEGVGEGRR